MNNFEGSRHTHPRISRTNVIGVDKQTWAVMIHRVENGRVHQAEKKIIICFN